MFAMFSRLPSLKSLGERFPTRERLGRPIEALKDPYSLVLGLGGFLRIAYTDGVKALVAGRYSPRQAAYIMCASLPALMGVAVVTLPALLFPSPSNEAFYHFANILSHDPVALIPTVIGAISTTIGLKLPLG